MAKSSPKTWQPGQADYHQVFTEQNPWHGGAEVPPAWVHEVERPLARVLWRRLKSDRLRRFQLVLGPRRVGKSTVLYQTLRHLLSSGVEARRLWWLRLDHPLLMRVRLDELVRYAIDVAGAQAKRPVYLFLDELVYARDWDLWLKAFHDERWPVRIAGSSSSTAALRERRLESGVGRWEEQYLSPCLFSEYLELVGQTRAVPVRGSLHATLSACSSGGIDHPGLGTLRQRFMLTGGFPELLLSSRVDPPDDATALLESQQTLRSDAVERAIYKDIPQAFRVDRPLLLERVLYTLGGQIGGVFSPTTLQRTLEGLTQPTLDRYLTYLERAFLVFALPSYSARENARQARGRKVYFVDGAVRNAALQRGLSPLGNPLEMGLLIENMAASHLHALAQQSQVRLYHWREGNAEVDFVYDHPSQPLAFEVASSLMHNRGGLMRFLQRFPQFAQRCYLVVPGELPRPPERAPDGVGILPLDLFLTVVGAQAVAELERRIMPPIKV